MIICFILAVILAGAIVSERRSPEANTDQVKDINLNSAAEVLDMVYATGRMTAEQYQLLNNKGVLKDVKYK